MKKTRHRKGDESTVAFWLYMKALYKQRKEMLKKYEGKLEGPYDHLKEGVDYLDDIQRNKNNNNKDE